MEISPRPSPRAWAASAAFFTRLRKIWMSWSSSPSFRGAPLGTVPRADGQRQQHRSIAERGRRAICLEGRQAEQIELDAAFTHPGVVLDGPGQERDQRRTRRQGGSEPAAGEQAQ